MNYQKQTQSKPILPAMAGKIASLLRMSFILMGSVRHSLSDGGSAAEGPAQMRAQSRDLSKQLPASGGSKSNQAVFRAVRDKKFCKNM
jgi:hypothetical protein